MDKVEEELVGVKEIARRANVSIATVDRVLHNRTGVSEKTREKISGIIQDLNYQPNLLARRLATRKAIQFAILIPHVSPETDFWQAPLNGIEQAELEIKQYGIKLDKYFFDLNDKSTFVKQTQVILKTKVDGVLFAPSFIEESVMFARECQKRKMPYIFIDSDIPNQDRLSFIGPDLFHTGYLAGHLINYLFDTGKVLLVNISKEIDNQHHLIRKEEGFRSYFGKNSGKKDIIKIDIRKTDYESIKKELAKVLAKEKEIKAIFVTNSRVSYVAHYLEEARITDKLLIGFDYLKENLEYLKKEIIDFLICQKPQEQGYRGIMGLYNHIVMHSPIEKEYFMPIDIITKENFAYYRN
jgi:LacI family transcriptional regulator